MAGRGTDIVLGGNSDSKAKLEMKKQGYIDEVLEKVDSFEETDDKDILAAREVYNKLRDKLKEETDENAEKVKNVGGLYILGTERHESRRIDNQLRGRSGRQGDPGVSKFYISLEDDLMRLFGGERVQRIMETRSIDPDEAIEAKILTGAIERAQKKVEANNFATRKHVLEYDDVMNLQRNVIYKERRAVLDGENMKENIIGMIKELIFAAVDSFCNSENPEEWEMSGLFNYLNSIYLEKGQIVIDNISSFNKEKLKSYLLSKTNELYDKKKKKLAKK